MLPANAQSASLYCAPNRRRSDRYPSWFTTVCYPSTVVTEAHGTEQAARKALGLPGGSTDHAYLPLDGKGREEIRP